MMNSAPIFSNLYLLLDPNGQVLLEDMEVGIFQTIVCPARLGSKVIVSPGCAVPIAQRSEPMAYSSLVVT